MSKLDWLRSLVQEVNQKHMNQGHTPPEAQFESESEIVGQEPVENKQHPIETSHYSANDETESFTGIGLKGIIGPSKLYRNTIVEPVQQVSFLESYPTFDKLTDRQLKWYLYWRQQLQKGIYVDTSEGYIFLYVFELLNFSFESKQEKVVDMMIEVYDAYKHRVPRVAAALPSWIGDMYAELGAAQDAEEWYEITSPSQFGTAAFEIYDLSDTVPPFSLWKRLLPEQSSFYKQYQYQIERCLEQAVVALDNLFRETKHVSLLQVLLPDKWVIEDARFYDWAVMERAVPKRRKVTYSPKYQGKGSTLDLLHACVRYIENHIRKEYGKKPLKIEDSLFTKMVQKVLDDSYRHFRMLHPKTEENKAISKKRVPAAGNVTAESQGRAEYETLTNKSDIQIDPSRVETLKQESKWVLGAIEALDDEIAGTQDLASQSMQEVKKVQELRTIQPTLDELLHKPVFNGTIEQLQEILDTKELAFVQWFQVQDRSECPLTEAREFIRSQGAMVNTLLDSINEKALDCLGDIVFEVDDNVIYWNSEL